LYTAYGRPLWRRGDSFTLPAHRCSAISGFEFPRDRRPEIYGDVAREELRRARGVEHWAGDRVCGGVLANNISGVT